MTSGGYSTPRQRNTRQATNRSRMNAMSDALAHGQSAFEDFAARNAIHESKKSPVPDLRHLPQATKLVVA
ncbi:predicted protein [Histoplasma mississippiense (nom. inval.)]|uniref:predicted protein n=1 Tax=Ajellomyces capsulatus (strain NAm1 / WU24) TaxID=2059318 RepID=UPI000157C2A1|nr:predicted protein [Histoplasma mississippiense (nom. inval.)]EDN07635.1 predicted protein [Histoplasma mississippiense (nom. inval.)]